MPERSRSVLDCSSAVKEAPNGQEEVVACARLWAHGSDIFFSESLAYQSARARSDSEASALGRALNRELDVARSLEYTFVEIGGWATCESLRGTTEALAMVLTVYGWAQMLGGAIGVSTATVRNSSSQILKRLGFTSFEADGAALPPYFDSKYGCEMEVLRFDSRWPAGKCRKRLEMFRSSLNDGVPVVYSEVVYSEKASQPVTRPLGLHSPVLALNTLADRPPSGFSAA